MKQNCFLLKMVMGPLGVYDTILFNNNFKKAIAFTEQFCFPNIWIRQGKTNLLFPLDANIVTLLFFSED